MSETEPDIRLNIGDFSPTNGGCYYIDHKYYIKNNYFYCVEANGRTNWKVEIIGFEKTPLILNFKGRSVRLNHFLAQDMLAQEIILLPFIEVLLGQRGFLLSHAGGIVKDKEAYIFLGQEGSMKTTIISDAVRNGYKTLGDDRVIIDLKNNIALSFPIFPQVFEYIVEKMEEEDLNIIDKVKLAFSLLSNQKRKDFWETQRIKINSIFLLSQITSSGDDVKLRPLEKNVATNKIIANNKSAIYSSSIPNLERPYPNYLLAYSYVFPESKVAKYWDSIKENITSFVEYKDVYEVILPKNFRSRTLLKKLSIL
jgi:hypothetical protein